MNDWIVFGFYFDRTYWPILYRYWPGSNWLAYVAPCYLSFLVPTENREYEVELECRTYTVPREPRLFDE